MDGRGFWLEGVKPERAEVESVEEVVARITGELLIAGLRGRRVRMIARIRVGGW